MWRLFSRVLTLSSLFRGLCAIVEVCEFPIAGGEPSLEVGIERPIAGTGTRRAGLF